MQKFIHPADVGVPLEQIISTLWLTVENLENDLNDLKEIEDDRTRVCFSEALVARLNQIYHPTLYLVHNCLMDVSERCSHSN